MFNLILFIMIGSMFIRSPQKVEKTENPYPLKHYDLEMLETGEKRLVETPVVALSEAAEFDVTNNAVYRGFSHGSYRVMTDIVDLEEKLGKLI